jgi:DNA polymerase (family 10)
MASGVGMDKDQVAAALSEIAVLLELQGENAFRCQAYQNGARAIQQLEEDIDEVVTSGRLASVPGIGTTLREKISTLVTTGSLPFLEDLRARTPPGLLDMMRIQGLGPKKIKALHDQLGIATLDDLRKACQDDRVAKLRGFGTKTQQKIMEGIAFLDQMGDRIRLDLAEGLANTLVEGLRKAPGIQRLAVCGSLRRRRETIKDIDILVSSSDPLPVIDHFVKLPSVVQIIGQGGTKASVVVAGNTPSGRRLMMNADLRVVSDEQYPFALHYFSGSKEHAKAMRVRAQQRGLKLNEYELAGPDKSVPCKSEEDIFRALGLSYIPPEMREETGEIALAEKDAVPKLIEEKDIRGVFHCHTTYSDGQNTLEEMAKAAKALGLKYLGLGDHSQSLTIANGMSPDAVRQQQKEIDALNQKLKGIKLFKGVECDILADGQLDYDDDLLATFDYVVASVHTHFKMSREEMTARIIKAIRHPAVTMLGHATGRLLLRRDGYPVDLEAVLQAAAESNTMVEINAHPQRLDLDWVHCKRARALGVKLVINPDAHSTQDIALYRYGVDVARRGWLTKDDVFNTRSAAEVSKALAARKKK